MIEIRIFRNSKQGGKQDCIVGATHASSKQIPIMLITHSHLHFVARVMFTHKLHICGFSWCCNLNRAFALKLFIALKTQTACRRLIQGKIHSVDSSLINSKHNAPITMQWTDVCFQETVLLGTMKKRLLLPMNCDRIIGVCSWKHYFYSDFRRAHQYYILCIRFNLVIFAKTITWHQMALNR